MKALLTYISIYNKFNNENIKDHFNILIDIFLNILEQHNELLYNIETNYLAVCFECLSSIYKYEKNNNKLNNYIFYIFLLLQSRFSKLGLYMFNDHTARIDITGHCIQGFVQYY
jgi:hypothetical protein